MADTQLGRLLVRLGLDKSEFERELRSTQRVVAQATRSLSATLGRIAVPISLGLVSRQFLRETIEAEKVSLRLANALQLAGRATTVADFEGFAQSIQDVTTVSDEAAKSVVATLSSFKTLGDDVLPRVSKAAIDYAAARAAATGTDVDAAAAARAFGAAINNPVRGLNVLSKGIFEVSASTRKLVKDLYDAGRGGEAFAVLLGEVERNTKGSAEAIRGTLGGSLEALKNAAGDLLENDALLGVRVEVEKLITLLKDPDFKQAADDIGTGLARAFYLVAEAIQFAGRNLGAFEIALAALVARNPVLAGVGLLLAEHVRFAKEQVAALGDTAEAAADQLAKLKQKREDVASGALPPKIHGVEIGGVAAAAAIKVELKTLDGLIEQAQGRVDSFFTSFTKLPEGFSFLGAIPAQTEAAATGFANIAGAAGKTAKEIKTVDEVLESLRAKLGITSEVQQIQ
ncbi:MAG: hypothetical protein WA001_04265, partial [Patescibacteria group bacterium]